MRRHLGILTMTALLVCGGASHAVGQNVAQDFQFLDAAVKAAAEQIEDNKPEVARVCLLSMVGKVGKFYQHRDNPQMGQLGPKFKAYLAACEATWKAGGEGAGQESLEALVAGYKAKEAENRLLTSEFEFMVPRTSEGKKAYQRRVTDVLARGKSERERAGKLCMLCPNPVALMQNPQVLVALTQQGISPYLFNVVFGPAMAAQHALQRVVPELNKGCKEALAKAKAHTKSADVKWALGEVEYALPLLKTIDSALKAEEMDPNLLNKEIPAIEAAYEAGLKRYSEMRNAEVDANRMPTDAWKGSDRDAVVARCKELYAANWPKEELKRVTIISEGYGERWESWWEGEVLISEYRGFIKVAFAARDTDGKHWVNVKWLLRGMRADGTWGPLVLNAPKYNYSYQIRAENIDK